MKTKLIAELFVKYENKVDLSSRILNKQFPGFLVKSIL